MKTYLKEIGCIQTTTTPYSPEENSHLERFNQSEDEGVSSMFFFARFVPQCFWSLTKTSFSHVKNLFPKNTNKGYISPYEFDYNKIPDVSHLRIWGCKSWSHIHKEKRAKNFNSKALVGYFVGYSERQRDAYISFIPSLNKLIISRDVKFDENIPQGEIDHTKNDYWRELREYRDNSNRLKDINDYDYLIGNIFYDPDEDIKCECIVTRIDTYRGNIVAYVKRIINNIVENEEHSCVHVAEVEKLLGTYLSENELNEIKLCLSNKENEIIEKENQSKKRWFNTMDINEIIEKENQSKKRWFNTMDMTGCYLYSAYKKSDDNEHNIKDGSDEIDKNDKSINDIVKSTHAYVAGDALVRDHESGEYNDYVGNVDSLPQNGSVSGDRTDIILQMMELKDSRMLFDDVLNYLSENDCKDPSNLEEALNSKNSKEWINAINNEYQNLIKRGVLKEVIPPAGEIIREIDSKLVFKTKIKNNKIFKFKVRLCAKGFTQSPEDDYNETYAPVARTNSLRIFIKVSILKNHIRKWMDVVAAYLYGLLNEILYLKPPKNWKCKPGHKLLLVRAIYGTKQAGRSWYQLSKDFMINILNLTMCISDNCIFHNDNYTIMILIYVDDILISYKNEEEYQNIVNKIKGVFEIGEEGELDYYLGIKIIDKGNNVEMNQTEYIEKLINKYQITGTSDTPMLTNYSIIKSSDDKLINEKEYNAKSRIGSLMFAAVSTRPDIMFATYYFARFTNHVTEEVRNGIERIFKYLNNTKNFKLTFKSGKGKYEIYCDADLGGDLNDHKSTSGGCETIDNDIINWWSSKQTITAQHTCDSESMSINHGAKQAIWTRGILKELGETQNYPTPIYCDNSSAVQLCHNPIFHKRSKHLRLRMQLTTDLIQNEEINVLKIPTESNISDICTKGQDRKRLYKNLNDMNMIPQSDNRCSK